MTVRKLTAARVLRLAVFGSLLGSLLGARPGVSGAREVAPNVVIVLIDALRADHLGCYGYERATSPSIDAIARAGVVFEEARSPASWTKPSIPSLFTGLEPIQHRVFTGSTEKAERVTADVLADEHVTFAEAFRGAGYATAAFVENVQIRASLGFAQGFERYEEDLGDADRITARFLDWLRAERRRPFLAYVHFLDPHWPYTPPADHDVFGVHGETTVDFNAVNWKVFEHELRAGAIELQAADRAAMESLYDGEIHYTDAAIDRIMAALREQGLDQDTILVITADHGEEFLDHGRLGHGNTLYDEVLHVPLVIRAPGIAARRVPELVRTIDIMPTLLDLAGIQPPDGPARSGGVSLRPWMLGRPAEPLVAFSDHRPDGETGQLVQAISDGRHKLIRTFRVVGGAEAPAWNPPVIERGDWLEIEGAPAGDGRFVALEIEPQEPLSELRVTGQVEGLDEAGEAFSLLGLGCRLAPGAKFKDADGATLHGARLVAGAWVQVKALWRNDGILDVRRVRFEAEPMYEVKAPVVAVERLGAETLMLRLEGLEVLVDEETEFEGVWSRWTEDQAAPAPASGASRELDRQRQLLGLELYDLAQDPHEQHDLSKQAPDLVRRLYDRLDRWEDELTREIDASTMPLDAETLQRLRALGYIE